MKFYFILNKILFLVAVFLFSFKLSAQKTLDGWQQNQSPIYANLISIPTHPNSDTLFVFNSKGLLFKTLTEDWKIFLKKENVQFDHVFIVNSNQIFLSENTPYQESNLYYWNNNTWTQLEHPIASSISDIFFFDDKNAIVLSYGEIAIKKAGKWSHISPPVNSDLAKLIVNDLDNFYVLAFAKAIYHYKKGQWLSIENSTNVRKLIKIKERLFVIGSSFLGEVIDNTIKIISNDTIWDSINDVYLEKDNSIVAVGNDGLIIKYNDGIIRHEVSGVKENLNAISLFNDNLYCIGNNGTILTNNSKHYTEINKDWKGFKKYTFKQYAKLVDDEYGVVIADFNKDGFPDIFTNGLFEKEHLYINDGENFEDRAEEYGIIYKKNELNLAACAVDIDNDSYTDLYLSVLNGKNIIYKNIKGTHFIDYSKISGGVGKIGDRTNAVIFGDVDNDGDLDLFIVNENATNRMYINNGVGIFSDITQKVGVNTKFGGNSASFADIDNDGDIDLFVTNWSVGNILYKNELIETGQLFFKDVTSTANVGGADFSKSNACVFADIDNDADLDLFVTNRKTTNSIYINDGKGIFKDKTSSILGFDTDKSYGAVIADFNSDGWKDIYVSNVGVNTFYINEKGSFKKDTQKYNADINGYSTGSALIDFDNDNDWDIYVSNYLGDSSTLLINKGSQEKNSIELKFSCTKNNKNAIGTKIYVYAQSHKDSLLFYDEIRAGSGYVSMNQFKKIIPVTESKVNLKIVFPNAQIKEIKNVKSGSKLFIEDVTGLSKNSFLIRHFISRQLYDSHRLFMLIKYLFVLLLLVWFVYKTSTVIYFSKIYLYIVSIFLFLFYIIQSRYFEYENFVMSTLLPLAGILVLTLLLYYFLEKTHLRKRALAKQNQIKLKLSRDLHDDLSATISSIGFYLAVLKGKLISQSSISIIEKAENLVQNAADSITDLIWAINPKKEFLRNLLLRLQNNYTAIFNEKNIQFTIQWQDKELDKLLTINEKQNIYLILKEAINNTLKYAKASQISIVIEKKPKNISIIFTDNGTGFIVEKVKEKGHGLINMQQRAKEIGVTLFIESQIDLGTTIKIVL